MFAILRPKLNQLGQIDDNIKMIYIYRYISLIFISVFFLFLSENSSFFVKALVVISLAVASVILNRLYIVVRNSKLSIIFLVLIETVGNILMLIPTGGLKSPYIWYAINTLLITLIFLNIRYCIANLSIYILASIALRSFFSNSQAIDLKHFIIDNSNLILGLVSATIVAGMLFRMQKELKKEKSNLISVNNELNSLNNRLNESIVHIMSLYQAVHALSNECDKGRIIELLLSYTHSMMKSDFTFFCELSDSSSREVLIKGSYDINIKKYIIAMIDEKLELIRNSNIGIDFKIGEMKVVVKCVKSSYSSYGVIGIKINESNSDKSDEECNQQLSFLATIGAMALERVNLEKASRRFLINDEQNRIANEIHDSVCQRLFAASCSIQALMKKKELTPLSELTEELGFIKESIHNANRELRERIYGMSWRKQGANVFFEDISNYINDISKLYKISVKLKMDGNQDILSHDIKNVIYRVICESVGNAMRHSGCSIVDISMDIKGDNTSIVISDNGEGFDINKNNKNGGLGINNIYGLVYLHNGQINIESATHRGTIIKIVLPNCQPKKEEAV